MLIGNHVLELLLNYLLFQGIFPSATKQLITDDLELTDTQSGSLITAFMVVFVITTPFIAILVDKGAPSKSIHHWRCTSLDRCRRCWLPGSGLLDTSYSTFLCRHWRGIVRYFYNILS